MTFFIRPSWMAEAAELAGGSWTVMQQLGVQVTAVAISIVYCVILTLLIIVFVDKVFGFRMNEKDEMTGLDHSLHGEHGYGLINLN